MKHKVKIVIISVVAVLLAVAVWSYFARQQTYLSTYQDTSVPFTFDYPKSWSLVKTTDDKNDTHIKYTVIIASDAATNKRTVEIRYYTYFITAASDVQILGTDCEQKVGDYNDECSYISNPLMKRGYFYRSLDTNYWKGELTLYKSVNGDRVFDKTVSIRLTLLDDSPSTKNALTKLAESISEATN